MKNKYKETLNIPQDVLPMRANLIEKELKFKTFWDQNKIYQKALEKNKTNKPFILHDGPPYANGDLHIGHALNKILKDIVVRYKSLSGFYAPFVPGWDTHGLPIENKILKELKIDDHKNISTLELRKQAREYALSQIKNQKKQFLTMQLFSDFKDYYQTLDPKFEAEQLKVFKKMALDGLIYKSLQPVFWSPSSQSALAEAEVEYHEHKSHSIYTAFKIVKGNKFVEKNDFLVIWTTTPWTLIANSGVSVKEEFSYSKINYENKNYIFATDLVQKVTEIFGWKNFKIISSFQGKDLVGIEYQRPIKQEKTAPIVLGHHVTLESGSGLVHMAPLFGLDDFIIGRVEKLEEIMHINDDGSINEFGNQFANKFYWDANPEINEFLKQNNLLLHHSFLYHSYPHDWRTNKPVIYRGSNQWFVSIDPIKEKITKSIEHVESYPTWGISRLKTMIDNRTSWTISRQRAWGVPIPIFYNEKNEPVFEEELFDHIIDLVSKYGTDIWFEKSTDELLPEKYKNKNWTKEKDIMDVWFDSGTTSMGVKIEGAPVPWDVYLEGSDQYRGWFNSSLINSVVYYNQAPFKKLVSHGFVLDEKGNKMSKSKGNVVLPQEIISKFGADILRLWVANSEYTSDVTIGENIINQNVEIYRKFRNTFRFLIANLVDFDYKKDLKELTGIHLLIKEQLETLKFNTKIAYENFQFTNVIKLTNNFVYNLSSFYLDFSKDILYANKIEDLQRKMIQTNFYNITKTLLLILAPILPTTIEEVYQIFDQANKKESVHLENFFGISSIETIQEEKWNSFFELKNKVYALIEIAIKDKLIKSANQALVYIKETDEFLKTLDLKNLLMVGKVIFSKENKIENYEGHLCERCRIYFDFIDKDNLCVRCSKVIL
ncbi:isoleucine--tRNA ligase [[Mycoplasma] mobile]|uniref:Isoleucine--tRNA ligase n=1 Tax=Mycoplasma mobile (strain ATCC 43663 / 163K / NCTC 11711) TaxID=267748 RepID=SYI_MYCM1|nr:isoleucine--tRNA ligase [[Mycoplasma] mobile]Q6KHN7.1 RecName: Full=Isoleucine--tRNA ligase; AltName: Full=Isoleucyl-tRNA synthetase; Short=IleRS [Mycoplasma mobile 163K]AAT27893.1 isoleucyl-tRNA synthetase [Mycoplasma mobile 163K]